MTDHVDLGDPGSPGLAVLLPGFAPLFAMPLLVPAALAAVAAGWRARLVAWDPKESREPGWVVEELLAAVGDHDGEVLVVGKSLATLAAPHAIARHPGRQLLVGGTADEAWLGPVAAASGADVLELPGADHGLGVDGDAVRGAEVQLDVVRRLVDWLRPVGP